ncbi:SAM-dependent methyltransferase [Neolewinella lacunae]|uniref:SAM-dependent methyltransferase n=1 Tax=Neolewinella lacunae TaxID=1517758 RepID=A0A923PNJ6_9BACT|nr:SAM-dependent methyltransferase [Neolewinella lacunae]MBC6994951.1 SAM-dependent methyltransferase [Neolewinella lacunae]MDN3633278.1 SAM-dependent methyltransferase [Neolewinella lacunae]
MQGKLYLIPSPLGSAALQTIPPATLEVIRPLRHFVVETGKVARAFLKEVGIPLQECTYYELTKHTEARDLPELLAAVERGADVGVLSDAGAPGVADPGARLVLLAHERGIRVVPLVGPSAILLSVMAAGLNGQAFTFHGYLSPKRPQLAQDLRRLEAESRRSKATQLWIEAPYRNQATVEVALESLHPETLFSVACDLTLPSEYIFTGRVKDWRKGIGAELQKRPAMFLLLGR